MTKQRLTAAVLLALLAGCGGASVGGSPAGTGTQSKAADAGRGSKEIRSESRQVGEFDRIHAEGIVELTVTVGGAQSVTVETDDNLLSSVRTETRSKTLHIDTTGDVRPSKAIRVAVTTPSLDDLRIGGTVVAVVTGRVEVGTEFNADAAGTSKLDLPGLRAKSLDVSLSGTAKLTANDVASPKFHLAISGAGAAEVGGAADEVRLDLDGACKADLSKLAAKDVRATLNGASAAEVNVSTSLQVRATGASRLVYTGNPTRIDKDAAAPSEVRPS